MNFLPDPMTLTMDWGDQELPTMTMTYPADGLFKITGAAEVGVLLDNEGGLNLSEPRGCRFLLMGSFEDVVADVRVVTYNFISVGFLLKRALVWDAGIDAGDGKRQWNGDIGVVLNDVHLKALARGWGPFSLNYSTGPSQTYVTDRNTTFEQVLQDFRELGNARHYFFSGRNVFVRFDGSDQSVKSSNFWLGPRGRSGMPMDSNFEEHVSHVSVRDKDGAYHTAAGGLTAYGRLELPLELSTVAGSSPALAAGVAVQTKSSVTKAYTHEFVLDDDPEQSLPWLDFYPGDTINVYRSDVGTAVLAPEPMVVDRVHLEVGETVSGYVVLGRSWDDAVSRLFRKAVRLNVPGF